MTTSTPAARFHQTYGHCLRLTVRVHVGTFHRDIDLSIPLTSAIAEILPEVLALAEAPHITRPWRASTAAGAGLDMSAPLSTLSLDHGHVLVLTPAEPVDAPIIRDAAEALVARTTGLGARSGLTVASLTSAAMLAGLLIDVSPALAFGGASVLLTITVLYARRRHALSLAAIVAASLAAGAYVSGNQLPDQWLWPVSAAAGTALVATVVFTLLDALGPRSAAALVTAPALLILAITAGPAATIVGGVILLTLAPGLVTGLAGLEVPRLPTAGQDLSIADGYQTDVDTRAVLAQKLLDGTCLGVGLLVVPSVVTLGAGLAPQLLCLAVAGATLLHAARHRPAVPAWSLTVIGLAALGATVLAADDRPTTLIAAGATALAATAVWWAGRIQDTSPTTAAWWERLELAAVIAVLPLAAWVGGLFAFVRGLG